MTTQEKLIHRKLSLLDLAEYLKNVSQACRVMVVSRQHFHDIKQAFESGGIEALREKSRRQPNLRNRASAHVWCGDDADGFRSQRFQRRQDLRRLARRTER